MKYIITLALLFHFSSSFSQWTRVTQLPASNIFTLFHKDSVFYAGGTNVIYVSNNKGQTWDSTTAIPGLSPVSSIIDHIIVYKNELYASSPSKGVFKSLDGGTTWQNISAGIDTHTAVTDLCEFRGDLYAATEGNSANPIFKLNPVSRTSWLSFSNGLTSISTIITSIIGTSTTLVAGANNNALYDYLPPDSITWEERFLLGRISPNEGAYDIVTAHDTLFWAGKTGFFYMSTDNGLNWNFFGDRLVSGATFMVNAKQALLSSRYIFDGVNNNTLFYYIKKDALQNPFVNFSVLAGFFTWKMDILGDNLWAATDRGLLFMPLSILPGISAADDSSQVVLPVHFISFTANCAENKVQLNWKTAQEINTHHFNIERSNDGILWTVIGNVPAEGNSNSEKTYFFTDNHPTDNSFYRIAEYDVDRKVQYTSILHSSCNATDVFRLWPNPLHNTVFINIVSSNPSSVLLKVFDSKGALTRLQKGNLLQGSNQLHMDISSLANGTYSLLVEWNNGQTKKAVQVLKQ
jgi:photosystem II stability/assembly factor-like uncharacterized protein